MAGNRRYKIGENPIYDKTFDRLAMESLILNPTGKGADDIQNFATVSMLKSKNGLVRLLEEWRGEDGNIKKAYMLGRKEVPSRLKEAESAIEKINEKFEKLKQNKINSGKFPLKEMPDEMREELLKAEAREDIVKAEIKRLETHLANFPAGGIETHEMPCLPYGPIGSGKKRKGILRWLDGQDILPDPEGVLRIKDTRSPYNGMKCADYFEYVVPAYAKEKQRIEQEHQKKAEQAQREGKTYFKPVNIRPEWPKWPENVKGYTWKE